MTNKYMKKLRQIYHEYPNMAIPKIVSEIIKWETGTSDAEKDKVKNYLYEYKKITVVLNRIYIQNRKKSISDMESIGLDKYPELEDEMFQYFMRERDRVKKRDSDYKKKFVRRTLNFTKEEFQEIQHQLDSANIDFQTFSKNCLLKHKIILPVNNNLAREVSRIGTNVNQIARRVNQGKIGNIELLQNLVWIRNFLNKLKGE